MWKYSLRLRWNRKAIGDLTSADTLTFNRLSIGTLTNTQDQDADKQVNNIHTSTHARDNVKYTNKNQSSLLKENVMNKTTNKKKTQVTGSNNSSHLNELNG